MDGGFRVGSIAVVDVILDVHCVVFAQQHVDYFHAEEIVVLVMVNRRVIARKHGQVAGLFIYNTIDKLYALFIYSLLI